jgi:hypothetical protein
MRFIFTLNNNSLANGVKERFTNISFNDFLIDYVSKLNISADYSLRLSKLTSRKFFCNAKIV